MSARRTSEQACPNNPESGGAEMVSLLCFRWLFYFVKVVVMTSEKSQKHHILGRNYSNYDNFFPIKAHRCSGRHGGILRADTGVCPYTWVRPFFGMGKGMWVATLKIIPVVHSSPQKEKRPQAFACDRFGYLSGRHADGAGDLLVGLIRDPAFSLQQQRHRQSACQLPSWRCQRLR